MLDHLFKRLAVATGTVVGSFLKSMLAANVTIFQPMNVNTSRRAAVPHEIECRRHFAAGVGETHNYILGQCPAMRLENTPKHVAAGPAA